MLARTPARRCCTVLQASAMVSSGRANASVFSARTTRRALDCALAVACSASDSKSASTAADPLRVMPASSNNWSASQLEAGQHERPNTLVVISYHGLTQVIGVRAVSFLRTTQPAHLHNSTQG